MGALLRGWAPTRPGQASLTHNNGTELASLQEGPREVWFLLSFCFGVFKRQEQNPLVVRAQKRARANCIPWGCSWAG